MPLFSYKCPRCNQISLIDPFGQCINRLSNGSICGYQLPFSYDLTNRNLRTKWQKHSAPPPVACNRDYSWVNSTEAYGYDRVAICTHGTVALNPNSDFLFLWHSPLESSTLASVQYATAGTVTSANGIIMPLNSKLQNLHHRYGNWFDAWKIVASGRDLIIEEPCNKHPHEYRVNGPDGWEYRFRPDAYGSYSIDN